MDDWKFRPATDLGLDPAERLKSLHRESGLVSSFLHLGWWWLVRTYMSVWHRLDIIGQHPLPVKPPFILVANHSSHLDALVLASPLNWRIRDRIFPIAAGDVFFETPMLTTFAAFFLNALPIWRKKCGAHTLQRLRQRLIEEPCAYILFPEGTRSRDGSMLEFKPGLGMLVANTAVPVVPCYLEGCFEALGPSHKWPRRRRIRLYVGAPLDFSNVASNREGWTHIAKEAYTHVRRLMPGEDTATVAAGD